MEVIAEIRRRHLVSGESISSIARDLKLSRPTVRKHLRTESEVVLRLPLKSGVLSFVQNVDKELRNGGKASTCGIHAGI